MFDVLEDQIDVVIHPQSIIHSLVEFIDGSMLAQLSATDMIYPIQYALTYPNRIKSCLPYFDWQRGWHFDFLAPDYNKFHAIKLAKESLKIGGSAPCYLNAVNEILVDRFLKGEISC